MSRRETRVRAGETTAEGAQPTTPAESSALASAEATAPAPARPAGTEHLTLPAVPMTPGYAPDSSGRILNDEVLAEARVRRAYLIHPNPPDDMPTGLKNRDGSPQTAGDLRRALTDEREATRTRELLVPTVTTTEVVGEANPTGDGDARTVEVVAATTVGKLGDAGDETPVLGTSGDAPPVITGATVHTRTVAPAPVVMRDGESTDAPANVAIAGGSTSALDNFGGTPPTPTRTLAPADAGDQGNGSGGSTATTATTASTPTPSAAGDAVNNTSTGGGDAGASSNTGSV